MANGCPIPIGLRSPSVWSAELEALRKQISASKAPGRIRVRVYSIATVRHFLSAKESTWAALHASPIALWDATAPILQLLGASLGDRVLDLGCGSGEVTAEIKRLVEPKGIVVGVDMSQSMITKARETTMLSDTHLIVGDIQGQEFLEDLPPDFVGRCNKIFSSAALHWCNKDPLAVLVNVHKILEEGGLFVAEMGGSGNVASVRDALHAALQKRGKDPVAKDPWFFPTPDQYAGLLRSAGLDPLQVSLHPRATPFEDLAEWVRLFGKQFLEGIDPDDEQELIDEVVARCRQSGGCHWDEEKKLWYLDYMRLRVVAVKAGGHDDLDQAGINRIG